MRAIYMEEVRRSGAFMRGPDRKWFAPYAGGKGARCSEMGYVTPDGWLAYFVTSEVSPDGERYYTIRVVDLETGCIWNASTLGQYASRNAAHYRARALAGCPRYWEAGERGGTTTLGK